MAAMRSTTHSSADDVYEVFTFDTVSNVFLTAHAALANCGPPLLIPREMNLHIGVVCGFQNMFHYLTLAPDGSALESKSVKLPDLSDTNPNNGWGKNIRTALSFPAIGLFY